MLHIGLGQAEGIDTAVVVNRLISTCTTQLGDHKPQAGIVYSGNVFDHSLMLEMITSAFPGIQLIGCTTAGEYSTAFGFSDDSISLLLMASDEIVFGTGLGKKLSTDPDTAIHQAVTSAKTGLPETPSLCLTLPEGYGIPFDHILNSMTMELGSDCPIFGGASGFQWSEDMQINQFYNTEVLTDSLPVLLMSGPVKFEFSIANSWRPVGSKTPVTDVNDQRVKKIGEHSAVDFYKRYLGEHDLPAKEFILAVYEKDMEQFYIRAPLNYHEDGSITFTGTIPLGAMVQLTEATRQELIKDTTRTSEQLRQNIGKWHPDLALVFSCAFRKDVLGTMAEKELEILKAHLPAHLPILGFYSFGEIAPLSRGAESLAHGATLISLLIGSESSGHDAEPRSQSTSLQLDDHTLKDDVSFLKRKLRRSEAYRGHLESLKDANSTMFQRIMADNEAAHKKILQKDAQLRKSEEKYRRIVQTTGEGFILMDENLKIVDANDAYCRMVGYDHTEIIGNFNIDIVAPELHQYLISSKDKLLTDEQRKFEAELVDKSGSHVPVLIHANTLKGDQGEVIGHMAFITDISEQKKALALAGEVQRSLMPQENPDIPGLDLAGRNVSCDEVGGDYFDFFWHKKSSSGPFSVVVGDITGHGVEAALLMTSARAFLRTHALEGEPISRIIEAANHHLTGDVSQTGRFMTLFYLTIDADLNRVEWVRAGHDPAIIYTPDIDEFEELMGPGIALGIDDDFSYQHNQRDDLKQGQIIALGTDGIWESADNAGKRFGKGRFKALIRRHADRTAAEILNAIFLDLDEFTQGMKPVDDKTLVIIKIKKKGSEPT